MLTLHLNKMPSFSIVSITISLFLQSVHLIQANATPKYSICIPQQMDCSALHLSSSMVACEDCSQPVSGSCATSAASCQILFPFLCTECKSSIPGAVNLLQKEQEMLEMKSNNTKEPNKEEVKEEEDQDDQEEEGIFKGIFKL